MNSFLFLLLFFFSVKKKRSVTPCETGWLLWQVTPQSPAVPAQHKARPSGALKGSLIHKLANAVSNKVDRLHQKAPEYQHYRYRQGQQPALASHRRTASVTSEFRRTVLTWQPQKFPRSDVDIAPYALPKTKLATVCPQISCPAIPLSLLRLHIQCVLIGEDHHARLGSGRLFHIPHGTIIHRHLCRIPCLAVICRQLCRFLQHLLRRLSAAGFQNHV